MNDMTMIQLTESQLADVRWAAQSMAVELVTTFDRSTVPAASVERMARLSRLIQNVGRVNEPILPHHLVLEPESWPAAMDTLEYLRELWQDRLEDERGYDGTWASYYQVHLNRLARVEGAIV